MGIFRDLLGTLSSTFQIGIGAAGSKILRFKSSFQLDLIANPSANITLNLPTSSGRLVTQVDPFYVPNAIAADHFIGAFADWAATQSGTSAAATIGAVADPGGHPGICQCVTGVNSTGKAGVLTSANTVLLSSSTGTCYFRTDIRIPSLSDDTNTFVIRAGIATDNSGDSANYVFFRYTHNVNAGNWQGCTRQASGTEATVDTGVPVVANTWVALQWIYDSSVPSVTFLVNGVSVGTITTAIPNSAGQTMQGNIYILKTTGGTSRTLEIDYAYLAPNPL